MSVRMMNKGMKARRSCARFVRERSDHLNKHPGASFLVSSLVVGVSSGFSLPSRSAD